MCLALMEHLRWVHVPAACTGMAATRSPPIPDTIRSGRGRCRWSSGTTPHSRRNPARKSPAGKQQQNQLELVMGLHDFLQTLVVLGPCVHYLKLLVNQRWG